MSAVNLSGKNISSIPSSVMKKDSELRGIDISFNNFKQLPSLQTFVQLRVLNVAGNQLTEIPHSIGYLTNLKKLVLNGNKITMLPPEIGNLNQLEKLSASNNQISTIARHIGRLTRLEDLLLDGNPNFTSMLADMGECKRLQLMNLSNCGLRKLPEQVCYCTSLIELNLSNNNLKKLPVSIGRMTRLTTLDISYNQISDLPLSMGLCGGFESSGARLLLDGNPISNATLMEKAEIGTDHVYRFLAKRMDATGFKRADLFTMKKSTINKKGHTIKMTIGRKERANKRPSSPRDRHVDRTRRKSSMNEDKIQRLAKWVDEACAESILPCIARKRQLLKHADKSTVLNVAQFAKSLTPEIQATWNQLESLSRLSRAQSSDPVQKSSEEDQKVEKLRCITDALLLDALTATKALQRQVKNNEIDESLRLSAIQLVRNIYSHLPSEDKLDSKNESRNITSNHSNFDNRRSNQSNWHFKIVVIFSIVIILCCLLSGMFAFISKNQCVFRSNTDNIIFEHVLLYIGVALIGLIAMALLVLSCVKKNLLKSLMICNTILLLLSVLALIGSIILTTSTISAC